MTREHNTVELSPRLRELFAMLRHRRPSGSKQERNFIKAFILPLGCLPDEHGNHWLTIGNAPILWSCHTDTVHKDGGMQGLLFGDGAVSTERSNCLGADCTTGVWLMANMIRAKVPGTYVFHANEEIGGLGSRYIAKETPERLAGIKYAIAFDRKGDNEIITHQSMERCCSATFARSLARVLAPLPYRLSDGGSFTDTANYTHLIPECTNISVGYHYQHTKQEWQDVEHAERLLDALIAGQWDRLECERDPLTPDPDDWLWMDEKPLYDLSKGNASLSRLARFCQQYPDAVAEYLEAHGVVQSDIEDYCWIATDEDDFWRAES